MNKLNKNANVILFKEIFVYIFYGRSDSSTDVTSILSAFKDDSCVWIILQGQTLWTEMSRAHVVATIGLIFI